MSKGAKCTCEVAWHVQVTVWCFLAVAMATLSQRSNAASARSWTKVWSNIGSEAGNVDEEVSSGLNVRAGVKSSTEILSGYNEQQKVEPDELQTKLLEADDKSKTQLVATNSHINENQGSKDKLATDSKRDSGSELVFHDQNTVAESRQSNGSKRIIIVKKNIVIILRNQIPHDTIKVKCQSLKDSTVVNDFELAFIVPNSGYTWRETEIDHWPNFVKCVIYWDRHDSYMTYLLYRDTYTAQTLWYVDAAGLYENVHNLGYVMVQPWEKELQIRKM